MSMNDIHIDKVGGDNGRTSIVSKGVSTLIYADDWHPYW
jgi:hypothetical protein